MSELLPFIVVAVAAGSVYGLAGLGLTVTYTTTGIFNFAHGALAAAAAFLFFTVHVEWGWPWPLALAVAGVGVLGGLLVERLSRRICPRPISFSLPQWQHKQQHFSSK